MKKAVYFTLGLIILSLLTNAGNDHGINSTKNTLSGTQSPAPKSGKKCFDESTRVLNFGIGFGYNYHAYSGAGVTSRNLPTLSISYEQPWSKRFGPGLMGVGGYLAYKASGWKSEYNSPSYAYTYKSTYNDIVVASRAMYHWDGLNSEKAEVYGGVILGLRIGTSHYSEEYSGLWAGTSGYTNNESNDFSIGIAYSLVAGARYYFTPSFGVYSELSYGISYLTVGLSLKI